MLKIKKNLGVCLAIVTLIITFNFGQAFYTFAHPHQPTVHHVVLFNLKPETTEADVEKIIDAGQKLLRQIPGVLEVDLGGKALDQRDVHFKNYEFALYVEFSQLADIEVYNPHEKHLEFIALASPKLDLVQVLDFYGD